MTVTEAEPTAANDGAGTPVVTTYSLQEPTLADRLKEAQTRLAARAVPVKNKVEEKSLEYADATITFVKKHPILAVSGAVAAGALIAFALPGKPGRKMRGGAVALGGLVAELAATYGSRMLTMATEAAEASQEKLGEIGESFAAAGSGIAGSASDTGATILESVKRAGEATASQAQSLAGKLKR